MSEALEQQFERQRSRLPGSAQKRREALDAFIARGFPTRKEEAWRYTDLKPIETGSFELAPPAPGAAARENAGALLARTAVGDEHGPRVVLLDGRFDETLSRVEAVAGLQIENLAERWESSPQAGTRSRLADHPLAQINTAFTHDGVAIRVGADASLAAPLELFLIGGGDGNLAPQPRISIELERNAALDVVVHCVDAGAPANWLNLVVEIAQAEGSRLSLHRLQDHGSELFHTSLLAAELAKDAALEVGYADLGARLARNDFDVTLAEPGASATLFGVFLASPGQHVDDHVRIDHAAPNTSSEASFRGIADRKGHGVFNGKVIVRAGAQHIEARQSSDNLLLADQAEIDTKPELEIYADDVKCSHGATIGELDAQQLFYMRSRGVDEDAARGLLTFAFANSVLRRLRPAALGERAAARLAGQLPDQGDWEQLA